MCHIYANISPLVPCIHNDDTYNTTPFPKITFLQLSMVQGLLIRGDCVESNVPPICELFIKQIKERLRGSPVV